MIDLESVTWMAMGQVWVEDPIPCPRPPPPPCSAPFARELSSPRSRPTRYPTPPQYEFSINF